MRNEYVCGCVETSIGKIPQISTRLRPADWLGSARVRVGIGRMHYVVEPGLYAVGEPGPESTVLVSANYKLSFDVLRRALTGLDVWILVLDTKGINVWCAAGKGTFGTDEIVRRVELTKLSDAVRTRRLIVPQLGAPGVAAHEVKRRCGFSVVYGPVRAADIGIFLSADMKATREMRRVRFGFLDRLVLTPMEVIGLFRYLLWALALAFVLSGIHRGGYSVSMALGSGLRPAGNILIAYVGGTLVGPLFLPWLPGRSFSLKGAAAGLAVALLLVALGRTGNAMETAGWMFLIAAISSFCTMNFTGASTYTSLSGVKKEMRVAVVLQALGVTLGMAFWLCAMLTYGDMQA